MQRATLEIQVPFEKNQILDFESLAEAKYGFDAVHPDAQSVADLLEEDNEDEDDKEEEKEDDENNEGDQGEQNDISSIQNSLGAFVKKSKRTFEGRYDLNDPFIDDAEMEWEEQSAVTKDGFFVYAGRILGQDKTAEVEKDEKRKSVKRKRVDGDRPAKKKKVESKKNKPNERDPEENESNAAASKPGSPVQEDVKTAEAKPGTKNKIAGTTETSENRDQGDKESSPTLPTSAKNTEKEGSEHPLENKLRNAILPDSNGEKFNQDEKAILLSEVASNTANSLSVEFEPKLPPVKRAAKPRTPKLDADGNPIPRKPRAPAVDANGNPIPRKPRAPRLDANGNPVPRKPRAPKLDANGNVIPPKPRVRKPKETTTIQKPGGKGIETQNNTATGTKEEPGKSNDPESCTTVLQSGQTPATTFANPAASEEKPREAAPVSLSIETQEKQFDVDFEGSKKALIDDSSVEVKTAPSEETCATLSGFFADNLDKASILHVADTSTSQISTASMSSQPPTAVQSRPEVDMS